MKTPAFRKKKQNKLACVCISAVVAMLLAVIAGDGSRLTAKHRELLDRTEKLRAEIDAEYQRVEELKEFEKYTRTKKYAEEFAEDQIGLVHDDEIIFRPDDRH